MTDQPTLRDRIGDEVDDDQVASRASKVITAMGADIRSARNARDRYRAAWHSARRRARVLSDELTRRAPLNGEYAAFWHEAEAHRLAMSQALGLGTGAPWDAIQERAAELHLASVDGIDWKAKYELEHARHVEVVRTLIADPAAVLRGAADEIDRETQRLKDDGVLEPDQFRPCRDATADLRRMADEAQQPEEAGR